MYGKETMYKRMIDFGKVDYLGNGRKTCPVVVVVELRRVKSQRTLDKYAKTVDMTLVDSFLELSICGEVWNHMRTDGYCFGQCYDTLLKLLPHNRKLKRIVKVWRRWHLNDLKAGTRRQQRAIHLVKLLCPSWRYDYSKACGILKRLGCYTDRGYRYGTAWLVETLPAEVVEEVKSW